MQLDFDFIVGNKAFDFSHAARTYRYDPPKGHNSWDLGEVAFESDKGATIKIQLDKNIVDRKILGLGGRQVIQATISINNVEVAVVTDSDEASDEKLRALLAEAFAAINEQSRLFLDRL